MQPITVVCNAKCSDTAAMTPLILQMLSLRVQWGAMLAPKALKKQNVKQCAMMPLANALCIGMATHITFVVLVMTEMTNVIQGQLAQFKTA
jgi:hypothetical protein